MPTVWISKVAHDALREQARSAGEHLASPRRYDYKNDLVLIDLDQDVYDALGKVDDNLSRAILRVWPEGGGLGHA